MSSLFGPSGPLWPLRPSSSSPANDGRSSGSGSDDTNSNNNNHHRPPTREEPLPAFASPIREWSGRPRPIVIKFMTWNILNEHFYTLYSGRSRIPSDMLVPAQARSKRLNQTLDTILSCDPQIGVIGLQEYNTDQQPQLLDVLKHHGFCAGSQSNTQKGKNTTLIAWRIAFFNSDDIPSRTHTLPSNNSQIRELLVQPLRHIKTGRRFVVACCHLMHPKDIDDAEYSINGLVGALNSAFLQFLTAAQQDRVVDKSQVDCVILGDMNIKKRQMNPLEAAGRSALIDNKFVDATPDVMYSFGCEDMPSKNDWIFVRGFGLASGGDRLPSNLDHLMHVGVATEWTSQSWPSDHAAVFAAVEFDWC